MIIHVLLVTEWKAKHYFYSETNFFTIENATFEMRCSNKLLLNATIYLPNGLKAIANDDLVVLHPIPGFVKLIIKKSSKSRDEGTYKCEASNESVSRIIEKDLKFVTESFITMEKNLTVEVKKYEKASFVITYKAFPPPRFALYEANNEGEIFDALTNPSSALFYLMVDQNKKQFGEFTASLSENNVTITIDNVRYSQGYVVLAKNPGNTEFSTVSLQVSGMIIILSFKR